MSLPPILVFTFTHVLAACMGAFVAIVIFLFPAWRASWSSPDARLGAALLRVDRNPNEAIAVLDQWNDLPPRTQLMLRLYVNAVAARSSTDPYAMRASAVCRELGWRNCDAEFIRSTAGDL